MDTKTLFELAPPVVLLLALNVVGLAVKKSPVPDWLIVWILPLLGGVAYPFIAGWNGATATAVAHPEVLNVLYGVAIGGAAVWGNQLLRQTSAAFKPDDALSADPPKP